MAFVALVLSSPITAAAGLAVLIAHGRPVLFRQTRPGLHGAPFELVKFRTMLLPEQVGGAADDAVRLTWLGRFLRATSLDELPSLWNIVRGDMSFVGPRPLLMDYLPLYSAEQARRHDVRPGLTGLAQVRGRNGQSWDKRFELDVWYVEHRSLLLDARILVETVLVVLRREGIAAEGHATMPRFAGAHPGAMSDETAA